MEQLEHISIEGVKRKVVPILERHGARRAGIFGSLAHGKVGRRSDVDILVDLGRAIGLFDFVGLKLELEEALGRKVDLVEYDAIKPFIKERILAEEIRVL